MPRMVSSSAMRDSPTERLFNIGVFRVPVKVLSGRGVLGAWISRVGFRVYHKFWGLGVLEAGPDK